MIGATAPGALQKDRVGHIFSVARPRNFSFQIVLFKHGIGNDIGGGPESQCSIQLFGVIGGPSGRHHNGPDAVFGGRTVLLDSDLEDPGTAVGFFYVCTRINGDLLIGGNGLDQIIEVVVLGTLIWSCGDLLDLSLETPKVFFLFNQHDRAPGL